MVLAAWKVAIGVPSLVWIMVPPVSSNPPS
jgi:hypothetical protein